MANGKNQYSATPVTDFYLDLAKLPTADSLADAPNINFFQVEPRHEHRPDLLSYDIYGSSNYWWIIALLNRNQLMDPIRDLKAGMTIRYVLLNSLAGVI